MDRAQVTRRTARAALAALAALGFALPAAASTAPAHLTIKAGTPQTAQAWVAARADRYETHFDHALVVEVSPPKTKVRFRCVTPGCEFPASDQPDNVSRVDPSAYDVAGVKGEAAIKLTIWTVTPETVTVVASPADTGKPQVRFVLNER